MTLYIPYNGGMIECAEETDFQTRDQESGQLKFKPDGTPEMKHLENRIVLTHGRIKITLNKAMVKAIHGIYEGNVDFREWVEKCK